MAEAQSAFGDTTLVTSGLTATVVTWKGVMGTLDGLDLSNAASGAALCYVQLFNATSATLGTTAPTFAFELGAAAQRSPSLGPNGAGFTNGILAAATTTATGSTPCVALVRANAVIR